MIMNKNINLCKILKGHEGEIFYLYLRDMFVTLEKVTKNEIWLLYADCDRTILNSHGGYKEFLGLQLFPSEDQRDWNIWLEEQKPEVPKTWSEFVEKDNRAITYNLEATYNEYQPHSTSYTPIEKSALALLKIHQLIEAGYGGVASATEASVNNKLCYFSYDYTTNEFEVTPLTSRITSQFILFHTKEQAKEFLKYPENIQLLRDYFMI